MKPSLLHPARIATIRLVAVTLGVVVGGGMATLAACGSDEGNGAKADGSTFGPSGDGASGSSSSSGFIGGGEDAEAVSDAGRDAQACVDTPAPAIETTRPVDIIFAIDNSDSMAPRIAAVENQINQNFASIIAQSKLDYRVIMLSNHGKHVEPVDPVDPLQRICVKSPLSGTNCSPIPSKPVETAQFKHHNIVINSTDSWCQILTSFNSPDKDGNHPNGWSEFLRPEAFKTFVVITDDQIVTQCNPFGGSTPMKFDDLATDLTQGGNAAAAFDSALVALSPLHFGSASARNYVWHSIIGIAPFDSNDLSKAWPASASMTQSQCTPASVTPGTGYQGLSKLTGGLRYPVCGNNYTTIFEAVANDVIKRSQVSCEYAFPENPDGGTIDKATAVLRYTPGSPPGAGEENFTVVPDITACGAKNFYIDGDKLKLCPQTCQKVTVDTGAQVRILFGCKEPPPEGPRAPG